jgi:hypothetical protein
MEDYPKEQTKPLSPLDVKQTQQTLASRETHGRHKIAIANMGS